MRRFCLDKNEYFYAIQASYEKALTVLCPLMYKPGRSLSADISYHKSGHIIGR